MTMINVSIDRIKTVRRPYSFKEVVHQFGGAARLARVLGISNITVRSWAFRDSIPRDYWPEIARAARHQGIPGMTVERLAQLGARIKLR